MNIYIKIEVLSREIEGRLWLALTAAERGHHVLLGDFLSLLSHRLWLPPGVFHDKSLTPSEGKLTHHRRLVEAGFLVTSQDEEHGLLQPDYSLHAAARFSRESLEGAARAFMWGPHDAQALASVHPEHAPRIVETGSPRVDLWRPISAALHHGALLTGLDPDRPLVLVAGHGYSAMSANRHWDEVRNMRSTYFHGSDDPVEWQIYADFADGTRDLGRFVRALRRTMRHRPDVQFVVRPHPSTADGAWESLLGDAPNLTVRRDGAVGRWIRRASLVVHDASTVGFETAIAQVPLASFWADGQRPEFVSGHLGASFSDADGLIAVVDRAIESPQDWFGPEDRALLSERFGDLTGSFASDRIVDEWDKLSVDASSSAPSSATLSNAAASAHRAVGTLRISLRGSRQREAFLTGHKFPPLDQREVRRLVDAFRSTFNRFHAVRIRFPGKRLVELTSGGSR